MALLSLRLLLLRRESVAREVWEWPRALVVGHYDGDTFYADVDLGRRTWWRRGSIRLFGIDTPELRPLEPGAVEARDFLIATIPIGAQISLVSVGYDKYADRVDASVIRKSDGLNVNEHMIASGHAKPYTV
jgi:endonuclease YncB( thermonuclease family)